MLLQSRQYDLMTDQPEVDWIEQVRLNRTITATMHTEPNIL